MGMYPFERFTQHAKKSLTLAQEEAERGHQSYIGTEHLLLGILRNQDGMGHRVLEALGVRIEEIRRTIDAVVGREERTLVQQIIPTSRVKRVIELSFEEAQRSGHQYVGTEHLLLGLLLEGEGIAAHVLAERGVTLEKARAETERQLVGDLVREVPSATRRPPAVEGSDLEILAALLDKKYIAKLLRANGLDVDALSKQLNSVPEHILLLRRDLARLHHDLNWAVRDADYERAAQIRRAQSEVAASLRKAEQDWLDTLAR